MSIRFVAALAVAASFVLAPASAEAGLFHKHKHAGHGAAVGCCDEAPVCCDSAPAPAPAPCCEPAPAPAPVCCDAALVCCDAAPVCCGDSHVGCKKHRHGKHTKARHGKRHHHRHADACCGAAAPSCGCGY